MKYNKWNIMFVVISGFVIVYIIFRNVCWQNVNQHIYQLNYWWLGLGLLAIVLYWFFESIILKEIVVQTNGDYRLFSAIKVTLIGQFFNGITPFASGGQPAQLYILSRDNIEIGKSGSILMMKFIVSQSVLVLYSLFLIIWKLDFFITELNNIMYLIFLGFSVDAVVILGLIVFSYYQHVGKLMVHNIIYFLFKIDIIKNPFTEEKRLIRYLQQFHNNLKLILSRKELMIKTIIFSVFRLTTFYFIPYFICLSFGITNVIISNIIAAAAFVQLFTSFVPVPGATGGAESSFYFSFGIFFMNNYIYTALLIWRFITYYLGLMLGWLTFTFVNIIEGR